LQGIAERLSAEAIAAVIHDGRGRMPPFQHIQGPTLGSLVAYVQTGADAAARAPASAAAGPGANAKQEMSVTLFSEGAPAKYRFTGYNKFLDPEGYPAVAPPWGTLNAIDLNTGKYLWKVPLGQYPALVARGQTDTGSENYGGPIVTRSGLLFIGATIYDHKFRAFDSQSGKLLWETELPFAGTATPATYSAGGRQFVIIATSNARNPSAPQGGAYVAYALHN
jgi:quinoprotein glucose dehydrogenase